MGRGRGGGGSWLQLVVLVTEFFTLGLFFLHCREEEQEGANREISRRVEMIMAPEAEGVQRGGVACVPLPHFLYFSFFSNFISFDFVSFRFSCSPFLFSLSRSRLRTQMARLHH